MAALPKVGPQFMAGHAFAASLGEAFERNAPFRRHAPAVAQARADGALAHADGFRRTALAAHDAHGPPERRQPAPPKQRFVHAKKLSESCYSATKMLVARHKQLVDSVCP